MRRTGRAGGQTHRGQPGDGAADLFAALDVLTGEVIGRCLPRHRNTEFLKFLRTIDREVPKGLAVHMILDNYATHKHVNVRHGWPSTRNSTCISPPPPHRGSIWWNGFGT